jgi:hypothetical protein
MTTYDLPAEYLIDQLRQEVARLNDERLTLTAQLRYSEQIIQSKIEENAHLAAQIPTDTPPELQDEDVE